MQPLKWTGPFQIGMLLSSCLDDHRHWPPADRGVYVITVDVWSVEPNQDCRPLYVGGNSGKEGRFCTRIGDLVADMFGFFGDTTGHSSGGKTLHGWCRANNTNPSELYLGWAYRVPWCSRCAEIDAVRLVVLNWSRRREVGLLNKIRPPRCTEHDEEL